LIFLSIHYIKEHKNHNRVDYILVEVLNFFDRVCRVDLWRGFLPV